MSTSTGAGRRLIGALLAALVAVPIALTAVGTPAVAADGPRYPNLQTLPPRDLRFDRADITAELSGDFHNVLRFSNTTFNSGDGPLILDAAINQATLSGPSTQRVLNSDGSFTSLPLNNNMYWHEAHHHYHFDNWHEYQLWTKSTYDAWVASGRTNGAPIYSGAKQTSCVVDEEFITSVPANTVYPGQYGLGGCDANAQFQIHMGLSVGWGDTYDWYRQLQWIDLGQNTLGNGTYVLRTVADPLNIVYESAGKADPTREADDDNEAATTFVVSGGAILDSDQPTSTVSINHIDPHTSTTHVSVDVIGRDDVSGPSQFRLSNDGTSFQTFSYTSSGSLPTTVPWDLANPATGGSSAEGVHTVYAQVRDGTGKWGPTFTDTIDLLPGAPPPPSGPYPQMITADGATGYWRLNETGGTIAADSTGSSPGVYNGVSLRSPTLLPFDGDAAASFSGSNQSVAIASTSSITPAATVSLEAWVKPAALPPAGSFASIVTKAESYALQFNGPRLDFTIMQDGERARLLAPVDAIHVGSTYHVVATYDGATQRIYINGALAASAPLTGAITGNTNDLVLGSWDGSSEFYTGTLDEVAVYSVALSPTQIASHFTTGTSAPPPELRQVSISRSGSGNGSVTSAPAGIACGSVCSASFGNGSSVTLTATPAPGSTFTGWSGGTCTGTATCTLTLNANTSVNAAFTATTPTSTLTITRTGTGTGTVTSTPAGIACGATCATSFTNGSSVTLTATPAPGSTFTGWSGGTCTETATCTLTLNANTSVNAAFTATTPTSTLTITRTGTGTGTVTSTPAGIACGATCATSFTNGSSVTLTATPAPGSTFTGWSGGTCTETATCTLTLNANTSVNAAFALAPPAEFLRTLKVGGTTPVDPAIDDGLHRLYVTRNVGRGASATTGVTVIDTRTWRVVARIKTGKAGGPSSVAVNPATHLVYVTSAVFDPRGVRGGVTVINGRTNKIVRTIVTGPGPKAVAVNVKTNHVYVTAQAGTDGRQVVTVISGSSHKVIAAIPIGAYARYYENPFGIAVNARANLVYATNPLEGKVYVISGSRNAVVRWLAIGGEPTAVAVNQVTGKVFVAGARKVTVIDGGARKIATSISVGSQTRGIAVSASRNVAYTTKSSGPNLAIDTRAFRVSSLTARGHRAYGVAISESTGLVYITNAVEGTVSVFADDPTKRAH